MKVKLNETVSLTKFDDREVLFCRKSGNFYGLNSTSSFLISRLLESDLEETIASAACRFKVETSTLEKDVASLVEQMVKLGLMSVVET